MVLRSWISPSAWQIFVTESFHFNPYFLYRITESDPQWLFLKFKFVPFTKLNSPVSVYISLDSHTPQPHNNKQSQGNEELQDYSVIFIDILFTFFLRTKSGFGNVSTKQSSLCQGLWWDYSSNYRLCGSFTLWIHNLQNKSCMWTCPVIW